MKYIYTFNSYNEEAYYINEKYFKRQGWVAHICSYLTFILSAFLWISIYYDKILVKILIHDNVKKSIKIIFNGWKKISRFLFNILLFFFCPNPFAYSIVVNLTNFLLFLMCWLVCSYDLRIFERYFDKFNENNFGNLINDLWCVFITMTTVGYGDICPYSLFGRIIIIISCIFGVFLGDLMVVSVPSYLNIVGIESNVYKILLKSNKMENRNKLAFQ